ncbi:hypothetical protein PR202_ga09461 [Eleusine coracana subsp. coracana]|uniref:SOSEKI DIX-like domain-containing protein n=1 Tax=Eleusine coracana subsp. coracana TaxID=191504 RepID=A0AAV5C4Z9_ELECO|nr:hypothetical protein PR202_ga09461 [Eleusine coracana subsp. coracana]
MDPHKDGCAGEVRRINVVYFLSRGGRTDHPHLFRVNHHSRAGGVRLRDVKRWLSEIRGKDMPGNFSWSYKRKYKGGYVWQDLKDDDLVTPVSDSEYVLKGCDVRGTPPRCVQAPPSLGDSAPEHGGKKRDDKDERTTRQCGDHQNQIDRAVDEVVLSTPDDSDESCSPKPPPLADQDSPGSTVLFKIEVSRSQNLLHHHHHHQERVKAEEEVRGAGCVVRSHAVAGKARGGMRVARALHSILTCGAADADHAALRPVARRQRRSPAEAADGDDPTPTCPGMDGCGLRVSRKARLRRGGKEQQGRRDGSDAHKPAALPRCSQCGKEFKPQDLHSHMQSCRGLKERMKSSTGPRISVDRSRSFSASRMPRTKSGHCSQEQTTSSASAVFLLTGS